MTTFALWQRLGCASPLKMTPVFKSYFLGLNLNSAPISTRTSPLLNCALLSPTPSIPCSFQNRQPLCHNWPNPLP